MPDKPRPLTSADNAERVARHGFGLTDEDIERAEADTEFMNEWNATARRTAGEKEASDEQSRSVRPVPEGEPE